MIELRRVGKCLVSFRRPAVGIALVAALCLIASAASAQTLATYTLTRGAATFGLVLPAGAARDGLGVGTLETQVDVKNRWPDGSIKFAIVTALADTGGTYPITARANVAVTPFAVTWPSVSVQVGAFTATLPTTPTSDIWLNGSLVRESRILVTPMNGATAHPWLRVLFDVRTYKNGQSRVDVTLENIFHDGGVTETYDLTVRANGTVVYTKLGFKHFYLTRHRLPRVGVNGYVESVVTPDFAPFVAARAIPAYQSTIDNTITDQTLADRAAQFELGQRGGLSYDDMSSPGGRAEIAPYPDWVAQYLVYKTAAARRYMTLTDDLGGSWPVHVADAQHRIIRTDRAPGTPGYWLDGRGNPKPLGNFSDPALTLRPENAHVPSMAYVSYLVTGDRYDLDELKYWANFNFLSTWPGDSWFPRKDRPEISTLDSLVLSGQVRAIAWSLRNLSDAAAYTPDADIDQAYFRHIVDQNLQRLDLEATTGGTMRGPFPFDAVWAGKGQDPPGQPGLAQWQSAMTLWSVDHAIDHGVWGTKGSAYRARVAAFIVRLFSSEADGFPRWYANASTLVLGNYLGADWTDGRIAWYQTMGQVYQATIIVGDPRRLPFAGYHGLEMWVGLHSAETLRLPGAVEAVDYLIGESDPDVIGMNNYLNSRAGWAIVRTALSDPPPSGTADTTPPTVAITQPANGLVFSGSLTIAATAQDDVGVVGVQFQVDGRNVGSEVLAAPYSISWNFFTVADGSHVLSAVARDAAGHSTTASVTVTVATSVSTSSGSTSSGPTSQTLLTTEVPAAQSVSGPLELGLGVMSDTPGQITAVRFWKSPGETGAHVGRVWSTRGVLMASAAFSNETASGWQQQALPTPLAIAANTAYVVSVNTGTNGFYGATSGAFATPLVHAHLTAPGGANGVYGSPDTFPTTTYQSTNYFRDLVFVAGGGGDTTPPTVAWTQPAAGAVVNDPVTLTATAADNVGVTGVQFQIDGVNFGGEITTAPYTLIWDKIFGAKGAHVLSAVARDAAGNRTTASITVTFKQGGQKRK